MLRGKITRNVIEITRIKEKNNGLGVRSIRHVRDLARHACIILSNIHEDMYHREIVTLLGYKDNLEWNLGNEN